MDNTKEVQEGPVKINKAVLAKQVEDGMKKKELAAYYNLSMVKMGDALRAAGLKIRKFHSPKFELVDDEQEGNSPEEKGEVVLDNTVNPPVTGSSEALADKQEEAQDQGVPPRAEKEEVSPESQEVKWGE